MKFLEIVKTVMVVVVAVAAAAEVFCVKMGWNDTPTLGEGARDENE